jgi:hypothetical protein
LNWEAVGAIGELVGAVAVIATLAYLAIQVRQNTRSMDETRKVETGRFAQVRTQQRLSLIDSVIRSDMLLDIFARRDAEGWDAVLPELSTKERQAIVQWHRQQVLIIESLYTNGQTGLIDDELMANIIPIIRRQAPLWKVLDSLQGSRPSFIEYVESITSQD